MFIGGTLGYHLLRCFRPASSWTSRITESTTPRPGKLEEYWGTNIWDEMRGFSVADFGCGTGGDTLELARRGARKAIGVDIVTKALDVGRRAATREGLEDRCVFTEQLQEKVDRILCIDCFEHFGDPAGALAAMAGHLAPGGCVYVSFGPPWYHPLGGHSFCVFPWAHLVFTEHALLRWRRDYCDDGATRFHEVRGGLNQMTLARFAQLIEQSPLRLAAYEEQPIRHVRYLHNRFSREFFTAMVKCKLVLRSPVKSLASPAVSAPEEALVSCG